MKGDEVNVSVCHFKSEHSHTYFLAGECLFDGFRNALGKKQECGILFVLDVEDLVSFLAGNYKGVSLAHRVDVEERVEVLAFSTLV